MPSFTNARVVAGAVLVLVFLEFGNAQAQVAVPSAESAPDAFDHRLAVSSYVVGTGGGYETAGVGGRVRWEFIPHRVGLDLYMDALVVDWPGAFRHDHPIGFSVYMPIAIGSRVRLRPLVGMCAVFSFIEPTEAGAPPSNDVMFGVHAGAGIEVSLFKYMSWFLDAQAIWYVGHDRTANDWSGAVSGALASTWVVQPSTGLQVHFL